MFQVLEISVGTVASLALLLMLLVFGSAAWREYRLWVFTSTLPQTPPEDRPFWERIDANPSDPWRWYEYAAFLESRGRTWEAQQIRGKGDETKRIRDRKW